MPLRFLSDWSIAILLELSLGVYLSISPELVWHIVWSEVGRYVKCICFVPEHVSRPLGRDHTVLWPYHTWHCLSSPEFAHYQMSIPFSLRGWIIWWFHICDMWLDIWYSVWWCPWSETFYYILYMMSLKRCTLSIVFLYIINLCIQIPHILISYKGTCKVVIIRKICKKLLPHISAG